MLAFYVNYDWKKSLFKTINHKQLLSMTRHMVENF